MRLVPKAATIVGVTYSGEPVVQTPVPGQERAGDEIQLQIVTTKWKFLVIKRYPSMGGQV